VTPGAAVEEIAVSKQPSVIGHILLHQIGLSVFVGLGATWAIEAAFGKPGIRPLAIAVVISVVLSLLCFTLTRIRAQNSERLLAVLACSSSAMLLPASFLPEYALAGHVWPIRTATLIVLTSVLFVTIFWCCIRDPENERGVLIQAHPSAGQLTAFIVFLAVYFALSVFASVRKYEMLGYAGQDLAYFSQIFYTTVHGRFFNSNFYQDLLYSRTVQSDFAGHNSLIQYLFVFFYRLFPSPVTLLVVRDAMTTLCAWPAYRLARNWFSPGISIALATVFLLTPAILFQNFFEFYPFSLAAFFLLFTFDCYARNKFGLFSVALVATLLVREDLVFAAFALGTLALWQRRRLQWSLLPAGLAIVWAVFSWRVLLPHFLHGAPFRSNVCFCHLGTTPSEMLTNVTHHPTRYIFTHNNLVYLKQLTAPYGFILSWLNPIALGALPYLAINLLGGAGECPTTSIFSQHAVVPTTFLFAGFVWSIAWLRRKAQSHGIPSQRALFVIVAFAMSLTLADLAFAVYPEQYAELTSKPYVREARSVAQLIPPDAAVAAPRYMSPLLANRMSLYMTDDLFDYHHPEPTYIIVDRDFARMGRSPKWRQMYDRVNAFLEHDSSANVIYSSPNYIVYQRMPGGPPLDRQEP
jgi:uncharacterized membrane protein